MSYRNRPDLHTSTKGPLDIVTAADRASEELLVSELEMVCPMDGMVGEEGARRHQNRSRIWFIDPLDGTFNYSRGIPFWCVSLGLVVDGEMKVGVVFEPIRDELFAAERGRGATLNGSPIRAGSPRTLLESTVQINVAFDRATIGRSLGDIDVVGREVMRLRNMGALALELSYLAAGRLDAVIQRGSHPWDYAAGILICQEAGATVTNRDGSPFDLHGDDALVAATPELHAALQALFADAAP